MMYSPSCPTGRIERFAINEVGRDFVVGDIHEMFSYLQRLLEEASFNGKEDRLFSVGDLVDRGPESQDVLEWLKQPWFHACRGNHEQFALDSDDEELEDSDDEEELGSTFGTNADSFNETQESTQHSAEHTLFLIGKTSEDLQRCSACHKHG